MFHFAYPERLYLLLLIPFLVVIYIISVRIKRRKETYLAERPLFRQLTPLHSTLRPTVKFALFCLSIENKDLVVTKGELDFTDFGIKIRVDNDFDLISDKPRRRADKG